MYTNILIPTDGSELAGKAVEHGIALAKRVGAKATVLTVLPPFRTFTTDTQMIEDTPAQGADAEVRPLHSAFQSVRWDEAGPSFHEC